MPVYFTYPETRGVRLEEMDSIFGDASTAYAASSAQDESASLMRAGSPVGSGLGFAPSGLPNLTMDDDGDDNDGKPQTQTSGGEDRSVGAWLSRVVRGRSDSRGSGRSYTPLGQQDDVSGSGDRTER